MPVRTQEDSAKHARKAKIWIDLDNSPHVPFFAPIIDELEKRGYSVVVTARDCFQVRELADLFRLNYSLVGHHPGKNKARKLLSLGFRGLQLIPTVLKEQPDLALSHGSRSQLIVSATLGLPSVSIIDYECAKRLAPFRPTWYICPEVIPTVVFRWDPKRILKYPGIKEDVYVPRFVPDPRIRMQLGLSDQDLLVTVRPPATEAHYHRPQSDELFETVIEFLGKRRRANMVLLPRNEKQTIYLRHRWPDLFSSQQMRVPQQVVNGLNLIWHSDLVISGGGTMNREAAALGVPVYSTFRGEIGAVDRYLSAQGRLILLENVEDVETKVQLIRRHPAPRPQNGSEIALNSIVNHLVTILESRSAVPMHSCCRNSSSVH